MCSTPGSQLWPIANPESSGQFTPPLLGNSGGAARESAGRRPGTANLELSWAGPSATSKNPEETSGVTLEKL
jgi:hypothetical protein